MEETIQETKEDMDLEKQQEMKQKMETKMSLHKKLTDENTEIGSSKEDKEEERKPIGHKAIARWMENNIPRTRKIPNKVFHKKKDVARQMATNTFKEYAKDRDKDYSELNIELVPIYE